VGEIVEGRKVPFRIPFSTKSDDEQATESNEAVQEEKESASTPEEDELTALRSEISALEATLRSKKTRVGDIRESATRYTQNGTLRLVAELADYKKARARSSASDDARGKAKAIKGFVDVLEKLDALGDAFDGEDEGAQRVARQFSSLRGDLRTNLESVGLKEFRAEPGTDRFIASRHNALRRENSDTIPEGYIMEMVSPGAEIEGNVVKVADVVVSLGVEKEEEAKAEEESAEEAKEEEEAAETEEEQEGEEKKE